MIFPVPEPRSAQEAASLSRDEVELLMAQRGIESSRADLVERLIKTGEFEEALSIEKDEEKKKWINKLIVAEARDDDHRCNCKAIIDVTDYTRYPEGKPDGPDLQTTPHYIRTYRHYSRKYQGMVWFYQCSVCGCIQSLPDDQNIDDLHALTYDNRQKALDRALQLGIPIRGQ